MHLLNCEGARLEKDRRTVLPPLAGRLEEQYAGKWQSPAAPHPKTACREEAP